MPPALRDIVVHLDDEVLSPGALTFAARLARPSGAGIRALLALSPGGGLGPLEPEAAALAEATSQSLLASRHAFAADLVTRVGEAHGMAIALAHVPGRPVTVLQHAGRASDLVVVSQRRPGGDGGLSAIEITQLVMGAGAPVIVVPHIGVRAASRGVDIARTPLQHVLVAWSGTRESARAARDALPLLCRAERVELVAIQPQDGGNAIRLSLDAAGTWLRSHGVACSATTLPPAATDGGLTFLGGGADVTVGQALLSYAADAQADLLVMGAYGHSRLWEFVLGGVTRTILGSMTVPVLLAH